MGRGAGWKWSEARVGMGCELGGSWGRVGEHGGERERERDESPPRYRLKVERIRHRLEETAGASGMISVVLE